MLLLATLFFLSYFNRFAGIRSGDGEFSGGMGLLVGRLPYRDYYTAGPPLNQIKSAVELLVFGKFLIVTRAAAVLERLTIAVLLYAWLRRNFTSLASMLGSLVTIIVSAGDRSDPLASYNHDAIFFAMICGYTACRSLDVVSRRRVIAWSAAAGVGAALSALTKQTVGLGVAIMVLLLASLFSLHRESWSLRAWLLSYLTGFTLPVLAVALYLQHLHVLQAAVRMLFISGPSAKAGHALDFVRRSLLIGADNAVWVLLGLLAFLFSGRAVWRGLHAETNTSAKSHEKRSLQLILLSTIGLFGICEALSRAGVPAVWNFSKSAVYYTLFGTTFFGAGILLQALRRRPEQERLWNLAVLFGVSWTVAVTLSLSWPAFEAMTLPGLAVLIAASSDGWRGRRVIFYAVLGVLVCFQLREKLNLPFTFGYQDEPSVRQANIGSELYEMRGMRLPLSTVTLLDSATRFVQAHTTAGETIFTYPEMGIFYTLADRQPPTRAGSHNIDVVPDSMAREEAHRLLVNPPAVILYAKPSEQQIEAEEALWRNGQKSGQRALIAALDQITSTYVLTRTFLLDRGDDPIRLYVRSDAIDHGGASEIRALVH